LSIEALAFFAGRNDRSAKICRIWGSDKVAVKRRPTQIS